MKRILLSISILVVAIALVAGGTIAFYSDTETSTGNIFVAGSIDLQVDHAGAYYNGLSCEDGEWECEPWADQVVDFDQGTKKNGGAVPAERSDPAKALGTAENNDTFNFVAMGFTTGIDGYIILGFDNIILNGLGDDVEIVETSFGNPSDEAYPEKADVYASQGPAGPWTYLGEATQDETFDLGPLDWAKYIKIEDVSDPGDFNGNADGFDVDGVRAIHCGTDPSVEDMEGQQCDGSWDLKDLEDEKFFNFGDVKPGDSGKNIISLHVFDNDAWACLVVHNTDDNENDLVDPEEEYGDVTEDEGELSDYLNVFLWNDDGDGFYEPQDGETAYTDSFFDVFFATISDSLGGIDPLTSDGGAQDGTYYLGLAWCAGDQSIDTNWGFISCDGSTVGDDAQTDSFDADVTLYVEQTRNNPNFLCEDVELDEELEPQQG